jgi:predicted nucleotidyltransferase component of viral defense system
MLAHLDRRVMPEVLVDLVRTVQVLEPCHLGGGTALSGAHLAHRLSADIDLFVHDAEGHRRACRHLQDSVSAARLRFAKMQASIRQRSRGC